MNFRRLEPGVDPSDIAEPAARMKAGLEAGALAAAGIGDDHLDPLELLQV